MHDEIPLAEAQILDLPPADPAKGAPEQADANPIPDAPADMTIEELVAAGDPIATAMYGDGGQVPDTPSGYDAPLAGAFDGIEHDARWDGNEDEIAACMTGRRDAAAALHDMRIPAHEATLLASTFREWHLRDDAGEDAKHNAADAVFEQLEREWGRETGARIQLAQRTATEAAKRLAWLADLLNKGAGNDPRLIKTFADIGLRNARRAKR